MINGSLIKELRTMFVTLCSGSNKAAYSVKDNET